MILEKVECGLEACDVIERNGDYIKKSLKLYPSNGASLALPSSFNFLSNSICINFVLEKSQRQFWTNLIYCKPKVKSKKKSKICNCLLPFFNHPFWKVSQKIHKKSFQLKGLEIWIKKNVLVYGLLFLIFYNFDYFIEVKFFGRFLLKLMELYLTWCFMLVTEERTFWSITARHIYRIKMDKGRHSNWW